MQVPTCLLLALGSPEFVGRPVMAPTRPLLTSQLALSTLRVAEFPPHCSADAGAMAIPHTSLSDSSTDRHGATYVVAPRKRHRRNWVQRQLASRRGRFELAIIGGGGFALALASLLPGMQDAPTLSLLFVVGCTMIVVDSFVGLAPSLAATVFAPLVVALTDPMWTLGATLNDFTLGRESSTTFAVFAVSAGFGAAIRYWRRRHRPDQPRALWRAGLR